jgi:hypothetical protein
MLLILNDFLGFNYWTSDHVHWLVSGTVTQSVYIVEEPVYSSIGQKTDMSMVY